MNILTMRRLLGMLILLGVMFSSGLAISQNNDFPWPMFLPAIINGSSTPVPPPPPPSPPGTVISAGQVWMDRNLGASWVATSLFDAEAYGDLFQWGRPADGHQSRTSPTTSTLSDSDVPGHGSFITTTTLPRDWRVPPNDNLWQGALGINNPCPAGFRLPTNTEWETERLSWVTNDPLGAFTSPLKFVLAGGRRYEDGLVIHTGVNGYYWSSTVLDTTSSPLDSLSQLLCISGYGAEMCYGYRATGYSVRCIED